MATFFVTTLNWNDPSFWAAIDLSTGGHTLDFSGLPAGFTILYRPNLGEISISSAGTDFIVGDSTAGGGPYDANLGGTTSLADFAAIAGGDGYNYIDGDDGGQTITGGAGADDLVGGYGDDANDTIHGGDGEDWIGSGGGADELYGDAGGDWIAAGSGDDTVHGGSEADIIVGELGQDELFGDTGDDVLQGGEGADFIDGGDGSDSIYGGHGDIIVGGEGGVDNDTLYVNANDVDTHSPAAGEAGTILFNDGSTLTYSEIENVVLMTTDGIVSGTSGDDVIGELYWDSDGDWVDGYDAVGAHGVTGDGDYIRAGDGNDTVYAGSGDDIVYLEGGDDYSENWGGNDTVYAGTGADYIVAGWGAHVVYGEDDADTFETYESQTIHGGSGGDDNDTLIVYGIDHIEITGLDANGNGFDGTVHYASGEQTTFTEIENFEVDGLTWVPNDIVSGTSGDDLINGAYTGDPDGDMVDAGDNLAGNDDDVIQAGAGDDTIAGGSGNDSVSGGAGDDLLIGDGDYAVQLSSVTGTSGAIVGTNGNSDFTHTTTTTGATLEHNTTVGGITGYWVGDNGGEAEIHTHTLSQEVAGGEVRITAFNSGDVTTIYLDGVAVDLNAAIAGGDISLSTTQGSISVDGSGNLIGTSPTDVATLTINVPFTSIGIEHDGGSSGVVYELDVDTNPVVTPGDDELAGGDGVDVFYGGGGGDLMSGDADGDRFVIEDGFGNDTVTGGETVTTGTDHDTLDLQYLSTDAEVVYSGDEAGTFGDGTDTGTFSEIEAVIGSTGDDWFNAIATTTGVDIDANDGADTLYGGSGDDTLGGGAGDDLLYGGAGADTLSGGENNDYIAGHSDNDLISGDAGNDDLDGGGGEDTIYGGDGRDNIDGEAENDTLYGESGDDSIWGGDGDDYIDGGADSDAIYGNAGNDTILGGAGNDYIQVTAGSDLVDGGDDSDNIDVVAGAYADATVVTVDGGTGGVDSDTLDLDSWDAYRNLTQTQDADADSYSGSIEVRDSSGNWITVNFTEIETFYLPATNLTSDHVVEGTSGDDLIDAAYSGDPEGDMVDNGDAVDGSDDDVITAGDGADTVHGGGGDDTIRGGDGADTIYGDGGDDTIHLDATASGFNETVFGGETNETDGDTLFADDNTDSWTISWSGEESGTATANTSGNVTDFSEIEIVVGSGNDDIFDASATTLGVTVDGADGEDNITGGSGDDTIQGGGGADIIDGGTGNDTIDLGTTGLGHDTLVMSDGGGNDSVDNFDAPTDNGNGTFTGADRLDVSGLTSDGGTTPVTTSDVTLGEDASFNAVLNFPGGESITLVGVALSDIDDIDALVAMGIPDGRDHVVEGTATGDLILGSYTGDPDGDLIDAADAADGSDDDVVRGYGGNDVIQSGDGDDSVFGDEGDDQLYGGDGNDSLEGGLGNDDLFGGLGDDTLLGGDGDDYIFASGGADSIDGGAGNDDIRFSGSDTVQGGDGDDLIRADSVSLDGTTVSVTGGEGAEASGDTLSSGSYSGDVIVDLTAGGTGADSESGEMTLGTTSVTFSEIETIQTGAGNDTVIGSDDGDSLDTGAGDDTIQTGSGDDVIFTGSGEDTITYADGDGADTIEDFDLADDDTNGFSNDQLNVAGLTDGFGNPVTAFDVVVTDDGSGNAVLTFPDTTSITLTGIAPGTLDVPTLHSMGIPCFTPGTLILTERGEVPVEKIQPGDLVVTLDHGLKPVRWVGSRALDGPTLDAHPTLRPVIVPAGAFGNDAEMKVSRQHGLVLETDAGPRLVRAVHAAAYLGAAFARLDTACEAVAYVHLLFDRHELVIANGAPSESFYPGRQALTSLDQPALKELLTLFPQLAEIWAGPGRTERVYGPPALSYLKPPELRVRQTRHGPPFARHRR